jgi:hypothetical protein
VQELDFGILSRCSSIFAAPAEFIIAHASQPWDYHKLSSHPQAPYLFQMLPGKPFNLMQICRSPSISIKWLQDPVIGVRLSWPPLWDEITANDALSPTDILDHPELPWKPASFHKNKSLTLDFYERYIDAHNGIKWSAIGNLSTEEMLALGTKAMDWNLAWARSESVEERLRLIIEHVCTLMP